MAAGDGVIGALLVTLGVDTGMFEDGVKKAEGVTKKLGLSLSGFGKMAFLGLAAGAAAGGAAMVKFGLDAINVGDDIGDAAARIGVSAVEFQKLQIAAVAAGGSTEVVGSAMDKLNQNLGAAHTGSKGMTAAFAALGLEANNLKTADQAFYAIAGGMEKIKDPAEKAKLSMQLFGKAAGVDMLEVMGAGKAALEGFAEAGKKTGRVFSQAEIDKLGAYKTQLEVLKTSANQMATVFGGRALIAVMDFGKEMKPMFDQVKKVGEQVYNYLAPSFKELGSAVASLLSGPFGRVLGVVIKDIAIVVGTVLVGALKVGIDKITAIIRAGDNWYRAAELMVTRIQAAFGRLKPIMDAVLHPIKTVTNAFKDMEDKVTGNSYVPDMIDKIELHFARLPKEMTAVAAREAGLTADAFKELEGATKSLLESLMTDDERTSRQLGDNLSVVDKALKAHILTIEEATEARKRLWAAVVYEPKNITNDLQIAIPNSTLLQLSTVIDTAFSQTAANDNLRNTLGKTIGDAFMAGATRGKDGLKDVFTNVLSQAMQSATQNLGNTIADILLGKNGSGGQGGIVSIFSSIFGKKDNGGGGFASIFASIFGGQREKGGPVTAGTTYLVGENGPELFNPTSSGSIIPNEKLMTSKTENNVLHFHLNMPHVTDYASFKKSEGQMSAILAGAVSRGMRNK